MKNMDVMGLLSVLISSSNYNEYMLFLLFRFVVLSLFCFFFFVVVFLTKPYLQNISKPIGQKAVKTVKTHRHTRY